MVYIATKQEKHASCTQRPAVASWHVEITVRWLKASKMKHQTHLVSDRYQITKGYGQCRACQLGRNSDDVRQHERYDQRLLFEWQTSLRIQMNSKSRNEDIVMRKEGTW